MKFSTRTEYGLRALSQLDKTGKKAVSLASVAKEEKISLAYLERMFASLKKAKIVKADLGKKGGYYLAKPAGQIKLFDVIIVLEGDVKPYKCADGAVCKPGGCSVHRIWVEIYKSLEKVLKNKTLNSL
ncbi:Rrf2 family transcriptional regulator [Candidatus Falkowbacteria bacterium]|jgi:Rrf2 family protein|nr:Rrf2 family transcriptional regulator [Candidatus Falkowbacteria bacterium]MBT7007682.1 Rrf2 family transcriptional regulator [Candidatus Falkowbacteria bacterium]